MSSLGLLNLNPVQPSITADFILNDMLHVYEVWQTTTTFSGTSGEIGIGIKGQQIHGSGNFGFYFNYDNSQISVKLAGITVQSFAYNFIANRSYKAVFRKKQRSVTLALYDLSLGTVAKFEYLFNFAVHNGFGIGRYALLVPSGGTFNVSSVSVYVEDIVGADYIFVGDSITLGAKLGRLEKPFPTLFQESTRTYRIVSHSAGNAAHQDVLNILPSILLLNPKAIILLIGDNDIASDTSYQVIRTQIVDGFTAAGIAIYHLAMTPELLDGSYRDIHDYIVTRYPNNYIETFIPFLNDGSPNLGNPIYYADRVHLNQQGHLRLANILLNVLYGQH